MLRDSPGPDPEVKLGDDGRNRGEEPGLPGRPPSRLIGVKEVNAKLKRPDSPLLEVELAEALLPWRRWFLPSCCSADCGTRTMVSLLLDDRPGFMLTDACAPHGSEAEIDPRRDDSLRVRVGLIEGL